MRFRLRLDWDDEYETPAKAKEDLREIWNEIEGLAEGSATLEVMDVQPLPGQGNFSLNIGHRPEIPRQSPAAIAAAKSAIESDSDSGVNFSEDVMGQTPGVTHPWDQGLWIFPEDHPFHEVERLAKLRGDGMLKEALDEAGQKMLGP